MYEEARDLLLALTSEMAGRQCENASCLGAEWCTKWNCCENDPEPKRAKVIEPARRDRLKLSLTNKRKSRFAKPLAEKDMNFLCKPVVPSNT